MVLLDVCLYVVLMDMMSVVSRSTQSHQRYAARRIVLVHHISELYTTSSSHKSFWYAGVRLTFKNGFGFNFVFPTVVIDFTCAAKVGPMFIYTDDPRIYYAEIASPYACIRTPNKTETIEQQDFAEA